MKRILPLVGFFALFALFGYGIWWHTQHPTDYVASPLINKPAPAFNLPRLNQPQVDVSKADLLGQAYLLNVFGSWCFACGEEHPVLMRHSDNFGVPLIGYNYHDETADARAWLTRHGNPYHMVLRDPDGHTAMDFGIYGAPETYLIDGQGIIRYKHIGPLTDQVIANKLKPAIQAITTGRAS